MHKPVSSHLLVAAGLFSWPEDARNLPVVPQITPEDYPSPLSIDESENASGYPLLSTSEQSGAKARLRVIQTAFDPELEVNKKTA